MANDEQPNRLNRDWIDWTLARAIRNLIAQSVNDKTDNPVGIGVATLCLNIVACINNDRLNEQQKIMIMGDVFEFMTDLLNKGWTNPITSQETQH